jgi:aspartate/methionine/tyrosine aminotransferase
MAGGTCVYVPLRAPDATSPRWHLDYDEFAAAFTPKTRSDTRDAYSLEVA